MSYVSTLSLLSSRQNFAVAHYSGESNNALSGQATRRLIAHFVQYPQDLLVHFLHTLLARTRGVSTAVLPTSGCGAPCKGIRACKDQ